MYVPINVSIASSIVDLFAGQYTICMMLNHCIRDTSDLETFRLSDVFCGVFLPRMYAGIPSFIVVNTKLDNFTNFGVSIINEMMF